MKKTLYFLIVDDVAFNQISLENILKFSFSDKQYNLNIDKCFNGKESIDLIRNLY